MAESDDPEEKRRIVPEAALLAASEGTSNSADPAVKEALQLSSGKTTEEIEAEARLKEHQRDQHFREHFEKLAIVAMYVMFTALSIIGVIWLLHLILPEHCSDGVLVCRWLTADQVTILQDILTGGLIGGLLADHFRKRMSR